jgi:multicomponent Na+:H+ antiporter subunit G
MIVFEFLSWSCILGGAVLGLIGGAGIHRFPDFYSRLHAAGITDTLCAGLFLVGLGLQAGVSLPGFKLLLIFAFLFFASPTATHALAHAAQHAGLEPIEEGEETSRD